jgi:hypothetical protein
LVPDDLRVKLAAALKARDEAKRDLAFARDREKNTQASLDRLKNRALQVFFENASPDTVFATDTSEMNDLFRLDGRECSVVLDLGREVEVLRGPALAKLPQLRNLDMLPMRVAYTKVLVCKSGGSLQVGRETGFFYRAQSGSNADERKLIAGRDRGMCDNRSETDAKTSVFGEAQYQIVESYRGEVDGIETIDLLRSGGEILRLHTGSSVLRASSCAEMRGAVADGDIAQTACKVVLGENMPGMARIDGCFTEQKDGNAVVLKFNP